MSQARMIHLTWLVKLRCLLWESFSIKGVQMALKLYNREACAINITHVMSLINNILVFKFKLLYQS